MASGTILVNTDNVRAAVSELTSINNSLESDFQNVINAINKVDGVWDGTASIQAISKFNKIKSDFCGSSGRKAIMNNYIQFLCNAVAIDYDGTEQVNTNLSELFK